MHDLYGPFCQWCLSYYDILIVMSLTFPPTATPFEDDTMNLISACYCNYNLNVGHGEGTNNNEHLTE